MADGNKERAMLLMANHVKAANAIYKNTGFAVKDKPEGRILVFVVVSAISPSCISVYNIEHFSVHAIASKTKSSNVNKTFIDNQML